MLALVVTLWTVWLVAPPAVPARDVAAVVAVLERNGSEVAEELLAEELQTLGPQAIPDLFTVLALGSDEAHPPSALEEAALTRALVSFGARPVRSFLKQRLSSELQPSERLTALRLLAHTGTGQDVVLARSAVQDAGPGLEDALKTACAEILRRDPSVLEMLRRWMLQAPEAIGAALASALADSACPGALAALTETLGYRAELDPALLAEIARLSALAPKPIDPSVLVPVQEALKSSRDPRVLRGAALALGHAQDSAAVLPLVELLGSETRTVSAAAEWALERITGLRFRGDAQRWLAWQRSENAWYEREGERLRADLRSAAPERAIQALGELSGHAWQRHELALATATALEHADPRVRRLACLTLARLGSTAVAPSLIAALADEDTSVVREARRALELLGLVPPLDLADGT